MESHTILTSNVNDIEIFKLWHERLRDPGAIMTHWIITDSHGRSLKNYKILTNNDYACSICSIGKLIAGPSKSKVAGKSPKF